jgi:hypothetical protein
MLKHEPILAEDYQELQQADAPRRGSGLKINHTYLARALGTPADN